MEPAPSTYALLLNNLAAPFDDATVRQAFASCVDTAEMTAAVGDATLTAATGFVPHGVVNRDDQQQTFQEQPEEDGVALPEDLLDGQEEETPEAVLDFRAVGDASLPEAEPWRRGPSGPGSC